ncbi:YpiF family protein [Heyndrickxia sporothermodurans]|uniref:YpiF family protein n=1 Tax=Heyndrickxia sporothermodurans TaxID=46224 RepID=UPI002E22B0C9|nr:YpiF family protein [Heyndrickxia sporothermodurans]MED3780936.1 YpiF family protein [Heyndrickxia sporothermodurans]
MLWNSKDVEVYLKEQQFIDTAVVPLLPISFGHEMKQAASQGEFIDLLSMHLERQFKGRVLLFPAFTYLSTLEKEQQMNMLQNWEVKLKETGFSHIFYLTSDSSWSNQEKIKDIIWLPSVPLEHMDEQYKHSIMEDQVKQLINIIVQKWQTIK